MIGYGDYEAVILDDEATPVIKSKRKAKPMEQLSANIRSCYICGYQLGEVSGFLESHNKRGKLTIAIHPECFSHLKY